MSNSLYRCHCEAWLKIQGWDYAIAIPEKEIRKVEVKYSTPKPGQILNFRSGMPLYENSASCELEVYDKYLLKIGWLGLEASQRFKQVEQIDADDSVKVSIEELTRGLEVNTTYGAPLAQHIRTAVYAFIVIEFSYSFGNQPKMLSQKYFFRLKSQNQKFGQGESTSVSFIGDGLYRALLSQVKTNYVVKKGTPIAEYLRETHNEMIRVGTGKNSETEPQINVDRSVKNIELTSDVRTNGGTTSAAIAGVEANNNLTIVDNPAQPFRYNVLSDNPSTRTVFYLGAGLFEGFETNADSVVSGANAIRNTAEIYKEGSESATTGSTGQTSDTYTAESTKSVKLSTGDKKSYLTNVAIADKKVTFNHPVVGNLFFDLTAWMEKRPGSKNQTEILSSGEIKTNPTAHEAFDNDLGQDDNVYTLFGGEIVAREANETKGNGIIKVKTNGWISLDEKAYQITEYFAHCVDHVALGEIVKPGVAIAKISNKSTGQSTSPKHLHGSYWIEYKSGRTYLHPETVAKFSYLRLDVKSDSENENTPVETGKGVYPAKDRGDEENLFRIVLAEGRETGVLGMALVARSIFNRRCAVLNGWSDYTIRGNGKTISDHIFASSQYSPIADGAFEEALTRSTNAQKKLAKEAIALAQDPDRLLKRLIAEGVSSSLAGDLILATYFATPSAFGNIEGYTDGIRLRFKQKNASLEHIYARSKPSRKVSKDKILCSHPPVGSNISGDGTSSSSDSTSPSENGQEGSSNTMANAIGNQGLVGIPKLNTSFIGVPRSLYIQPGFTYLVFDTRNFLEWARNKGKGKDFKIPIPLEYKDWSITSVEYKWEGDLKVNLEALRPISGLDEAFKFTGDEFKDVAEWKGNYYKYIRSFTDLCYPIKSGEYAGKNSCDVKIDINTAFLPRSSEPTDVNDGTSNTVDAGDWVLPATGIVTSVWGIRSSGFHKGVDIATQGDSNIYAARSGVLSIPAFDSNGYGNWVKIVHSDGYETHYGHLSSIKAIAGNVKANDIIGVEGTTGRSTGNHLHWTVIKDGQKIDPAKIFPELGKKGTVITKRSRSSTINTGNSTGFVLGYPGATIKSAHQNNFEVIRGKRTIDTVVIHHTNINLAGTIAIFKDPSKEVSAHYVVARDGQVIQMVEENNKAYHAKAGNATSIGIEHEAYLPSAKGLTVSQEKATISLIRYLQKKYNISRTKILPHRVQWGGFVDTLCPTFLFPTEESFQAWVEKNF